MSRASDTAYREIRVRILSGDLAPGSQLKEEELASMCGVSRTPVREALQRLEAEMLVRRSDTQRSFVPDWSPGEVEEIFTLRSMLESHAARRAAALITPAQLEALRECNNSLAVAVHRPEAPDIDGFVESNRTFHGLVLEAASSERLTKMRSLIVEQMIVHRTARQYNRDNLLRSHAEHQDLIEAFAKHDGEWAAAIMTAHIRRAAHSYAEIIEARPTP